MWTESSEETKPLRSGLTTGSCATACALTAARFLLLGTKATSCDIKLPKGKTVNLPIIECEQRGEQTAYTATIKDAGDDPDVTHGAKVFTLTSLINDNKVEFAAAQGVGTVTRAGLALAIGEPAINPVPRQMISEHLEQLKVEHGYQGGFKVAIGVENGEALALKTMNPRLGILGGLSILGTTGIVRPFSCAAYIASIHQGIDVAQANGITHMAACTGNLSEQYATEAFALSDMALLEMGDFVGAVFKYLNRKGLKKAPIEHLSIVGGFGKISKLACGHKDLNSRVSSIDFDFFVNSAAELGASSQILEEIKQANTSLEVLTIAKDLSLANRVCQSAWHHARLALPADIKLDVWAIDRQGKLIGSASSNHLTSGGVNP